MPRGQCHLCHNDSELQLSHIFPAFVFRWLRESSGNGHIRESTSPNKRIQDGLKRYWLCSSCEGIFGRSEKAFADQLFYPYLTASGKRFEYSRWLLHFCTAISWRVLHFYISENHLDELDSQMMAHVSQAEETWRDFLLGRRPHPGLFRQHFLPLDQVESATGSLASNINRYFMRAVHMDFCHGDQTIFTYAKLGHFIILGFIREPNPNQWRGTKVNNEGFIEPREYILPAPFGKYLNNKARHMSQALNSMSDRQKQKVEESFRANPDTYIGSNSFAAMQADVALFGDKAFDNDKDHNDF